MKAKFKTIVKRKEWGRGEGDGRLLFEDGMKCCLGFRCQQAGILPRYLLDQGMPYEVKGKYRLPTWLRDEESSAAQQAAKVNDDQSMSEELREAKLKEIFAQQGEEIEFVD